jgi:phage regulator Rha-like protein
MAKRKIKPQVEQVGGDLYVRSTNFANVFGIAHRDLLKRIRKDRGNLSKFSPIFYQDSYGRSQPEFLISEDGFHLLTQKYKTVSPRSVTAATRSPTPARAAARSGWPVVALIDGNV